MIIITVKGGCVIEVNEVDDEGMAIGSTSLLEEGVDYEVNDLDILIEPDEQNGGE
jgi:hypothetical protein